MFHNFIIVIYTFSLNRYLTTVLDISFSFPLSLLQRQHISKASSKKQKIILKLLFHVYFPLPVTVFAVTFRSFNLFLLLFYLSFCLLLSLLLSSPARERRGWSLWLLAVRHTCASSTVTPQLLKPVHTSTHCQIILFSTVVVGPVF